MQQFFIAPILLLNPGRLYVKMSIAEYSQPRGVAQLAEHRSPKPRAAGSIPVSPAIQKQVTAHDSAVLYFTRFYYFPEMLQP
jgi:hypothetical protein